MVVIAEYSTLKEAREALTELVEFYKLPDVYVIQSTLEGKWQIVRFE